MRISTTKTKITEFKGKNHVICKIMIYNKTIEHVSSSSYLGFNVPNCLKEYMNVKLSKFQRICGMIRRTMKEKP
jgi:hypothetical protein